MRKILELYFQICIVSDADIEQNDSLIKETKNEIRVKIKRVSQMYKLNKTDVNLKRRASDHLNL